MGLKGQLADLPLIDMLQIIAFSKKSGYLRVAGPSGRGAVIIKEGRVLFAFSWSSMSRIREMARDPDKISIEANRENIETALRELAGLREGSFKFELTDDISDDLGGVRIKPFMIPGGIDPQELLLDLAVEIDNERREATTLLELAFEGDPPAEDPITSDHDRIVAEELPPRPGLAEFALEPTAAVEEIETAASADVEPGPIDGESSSAEAVPCGDDASCNDSVPDPKKHTVVIVDDEPPVTEVVSQELRSKGYTVYTACSPGAGSDLIQTRRRNGETILAAIDLKMPTSSGESFYGGFELIRRLHADHGKVPVLLMVESLSNAARDQARALGVRRIVYKPTLTKPDPELYRADLREFTVSLEAQLFKLVEDQHGELDAATYAPTAESDADRVDFLAAMTKRLVEPGGSTDVSRLVVQVAARFLERGVLFVVKSETVHGLAGYGFGTNANDCAVLTRKLTLPLESIGPLTEVVSTGRTLRVTEDLGVLESGLFERIGRGNASEGVLIPMLYNRATLLLLYGDNGVSGQPLGDLGGLELFMAQAGMALENKLLQRKLSTRDEAMVSDVGRSVPL